MERAAKSLSQQFKARLEQCLESLDRGLQHLCGQDGAAIGVQGVKALTQAADMLYKLHALEEGKPTDITGRVRITPQNLFNKLKEIDPFGEYGGDGKSDSNGPTVN